MATAEMKFTKGALDDAAHTGGQATRYRDPRNPNLYLEVRARPKTWRFRKFWKGQNFTETLGTWPQMSVVEAAQEAAVRSDGIEEKGVLIKNAGPRNAPEITLRLALEQHVTQALDPRQRKVSAETAAGYAAPARPPVARHAHHGHHATDGQREDQGNVEQADNGKLPVARAGRGLRHPTGL